MSQDQHGFKCSESTYGGGDRPSARGGSGKPALLDPPLPSGRWQPMWVRVGNIWPPRADRVVQGEEYDSIHFATMSLSASILCLPLSTSMPLF